MRQFRSFLQIVFVTSTMFLSTICLAQSTSAPEVSSVSPASARAGDQVTITGSGFGASQGNGNVWLGSTYGNPVSWSDTQVVATVATGAKSGTAQILQGGVWSNSVNLTVITPNITSVSPTSATAGTQVTITGTGFGTTQGSGNVWLGSTYGTVVSWSDTQVVATVVSGAKSGSAQILQGGVWSNSVNLTVITPNITSVSPTSATAGTQVTITGTGFGTTQGSGNVWLGSTYGTVVSWSDTQVVASVASGSKSGSAQILQGGVWSNSVNLTVITPNIASVSPTSATAGTQVTITGTGFGTTQGSGNVWLGSTYGTVVSWSDTQVVATAASGAKSGTAQILQGGVWSNAVNFAVVSGPNITSVSPTSGPAGTWVTISGAGFGASQGNGFILLGTNNGLVMSWSDTQITAVVAPGSASGTVQVTQNGAASNSLSFGVTALTIANVTPQSGGAGTQVTITGSGFGASQGNGSVLLGTLNGQVVSWSDTQVIATVAGGSASGRAQIIQGIGSNAVNFTVNAPVVTGVNPTSGAAGTQVTITGSGFGAAQGNGKVLLGTAYGAVASWSDTQVAATVATGSNSGYAQIIQGTPSNAMVFTVTVPTITSVSPTSGMAGTQVTISGSGFGAAQGNGNVWLGSAYGSVISWGDSQVVATVAAGSGSGIVQILQNGVWSNSLPFTTGIPQVTSITPTSGTGGTQVTFTGSGFGATQGSGAVWLGNTYGSVVSWSDTQVVATVASGAVTGIARIQQNGIWSNSKRFVVPTVGPGNAVILNPQLMSMLVGETRSIQALDTHGAAIKGLTWTSSDTSIASLSTDDPPVITAVAAGHVTITAGDASADLTVYAGSSLPLGTVIWSAPGDDSGVANILPAVPSSQGVADVFAVMTSGVVQAITSDGSVAWTANVGNAYNSLLPDFQGGLVETTATSIMKWDGMTGQQTSQYTFANPVQNNPVASHTDGTIFTIDGDSVIGIDPQSGTAKFSIPLEHSTADFAAGTELCVEPPIVHSDSPPTIGSSAMAGDGNFYVAYTYTNSSTSGSPCLGTSFSNSFHSRMLRVDSSGNAQKILSGDSSDTGATIGIINNGYEEFVSTENVQGLSISAGSIVTNADSGVLVAWSGSAPAYCALIQSTTGSSGCVPAVNQSGLMTISTGDAVSQSAVPGNFILGLALQGTDGTYYGPTDTGSLTAFDQSGNIKWAVPGYYAAMLTSDGGLVAQSADGLTTAIFDANGNAIGQLGTLPTESWIGNGYRFGSADQVAFTFPNLASTFAALLFQNASANGTPIQQEWFPQLQSCLGAQTPCPREAIWDALKSLRSVVGNPCPACVTYVFSNTKLGSDASGSDQRAFFRFLGREPRLFDGTRSNLPMNKLCGSGFWNFLTCEFGSQTVSQYFATKTPDVISETPAEQGKGMMSFFNPSTICKSAASSPPGVLNQATLFHEALHGFYGLNDRNLVGQSLMGGLGLDQSLSTAAITYYLEDNVLGGGPQTCGN